jgi:FkbM family methyltransferase
MTLDIARLQLPRLRPGSSDNGQEWAQPERPLPRLTMVYIESYVLEELATLIRSLMERLSRGKAIRRHMPDEFGRRPLYLSPDSALSYLKPDWAKASSELLSAAAKYVNRSDNVWDIGGNVGVFTIAAAHAAGPDAEIVTVEADPFLASLLQRTALDPANADRHINVLCAAVSCSVGVARFLIAERGRSSNALEQSGHRSQAGGTRFVQHVPTVTLDALLKHFARPRVIKIDVEGAETSVLQGATRVLAECRPLFYVEVGAEQNADVTAEFQRHRYRLYNGDSDDEVELTHCAFNTLAVPYESTRTNRRT